MQSGFAKKSAAMLTVGTAFLMFGVDAQARVYFVTDTNDTTAVTSLRGAVIAANRHAGNNTIVLGRETPHGDKPRQSRQWTYHLTIRGPDEDATRTGDLDILRGELSIVGANSNVVIEATGLRDRVFQVFPHGHLTLENLIISGGVAGGNLQERGGEHGGAICNAGTLVINRCIIVGNSSGNGGDYAGHGGDGGAIQNTGSLFLNTCILAENSSGNGSFGGNGGNGGGICNAGLTVMSNCEIISNSGGTGSGGTVTGNGPKGGDGGGVYNAGIMVMKHCVVSSNACGSGTAGSQSLNSWDFGHGGLGGAGGNGGGVYNSGKLELDSCTLAGNSAGVGGVGGGYFDAAGNGGTGGNGGGIFNGNCVSLNNCTISGNFCGTGGTGGPGFLFGVGNGGNGGSGGGVYNAGSVSLSFSTVTLNLTGAGGKGGDSINCGAAASGGSGGKGGGVFTIAETNHVGIYNTLIVLNSVNIGGNGGTNYDYPAGFSSTPIQTTGGSGSVGSGLDVSGDFASEGFNLIGVADDSTGFLNSDLVGRVVHPIDPLLGPLRLNGGFTPTHALLPGSPAIDQGNSFRIHTDQRGQHRPYDYDSIPNALGGDGSDIGAFELGPDTCLRWGKVSGEEWGRR